MDVKKIMLDLTISELKSIEKERNINGYQDMYNNNFKSFFIKQPHLTKK